MKTTNEIKDICEEIKLNMEKRRIDEERNEALRSVNYGVSAYAVSLLLRSLHHTEQIIDAKLMYLHAKQSLRDYRKSIEAL